MKLGPRVPLLDVIILFLVSWLCYTFLNLDYCVQLQPMFGLLLLLALLQPLKSESAASIWFLFYSLSRKQCCLIISSIYSLLNVCIYPPMKTYNIWPLDYCIIAEGFHFISQVLGRTIDLRSLITQRMNKIFRENIDFLLERFENGDLCGVVVRMYKCHLYIL